MQRNLKIITTILLIGLAVTSQAQWKSLIKENTLIGWKTRGGEATYQVKDGIIIGTAMPETPNSFLVRDTVLGDFIMEVDVFVDTKLNSGIQIRSNSNSDYREGVFHGYQVEIDPSERSWSGGIYDEQRRGWLYPLSRNIPAKDALKMGEWNTFHIEAIGNTINTWINGVHCARLSDDMTSKGKIGLQIHSIESGVGLEGAQVKWRDPKIVTENFEKYQLKKDVSVPEVSYLSNQLTEWEKRNGFRLLWDGETSAGWRGAKLDHFPRTGWEIKDGMLTVQKSGGKEAAGPGDIITVNEFRDFELILDFKITEGANSGIKYFVDPDLNKGAGSAIGCEYQILDDNKHPDAKQGKNGNRTVGSLYDLITAKNLSDSSRSKPFKGVGTWNQARIVSVDGKIEHWLNNEKIVEYDRFSPLFESLVADSKYAGWEGFGQWPQGHILLQDHGDKVSFRNIKIRELNGL